MTYDYLSARVHDLEQIVHAATCKIEELEEQNRILRKQRVEEVGFDEFWDIHSHVSYHSAKMIFDWLVENCLIREAQR